MFVNVDEPQQAKAREPTKHESRNHCSQQPAEYSVWWPSLRMEVDRKIPAVKLFVSQLDKARQPLESTDGVVSGMDTPNLVGLALHGVGFTRVWLQVQSILLSAVSDVCLCAVICLPAVYCL